MEKRILGRTNLNVSVIGFGGIPIQGISKEDVKKVILKALDSGINFIDTARRYTDSEEKIGYAIKDWKKKPILATKAMVTTKEEMDLSLNESFSNLGVNYIDLYQVHNIATEERLQKVIAPNGAIQSLKEAKKHGKVGFIGVSSHKPEILIKCIKTGIFDTIQVPFNAVEYKAFLPAIVEANKHNLGIIIMKPLAGGNLKHGKEALQFILDFDIHVVIPGMRSVEEVSNNAKAGEEKLTEPSRRLLLEEAKSLGRNFCRMCEYCMPCPQGINIPGVMVMNAYYERYELKDWAKQGIKKMTPVLPSECANCGICESRCPYELPIREHMKKATKNLL